MTAHRPECSRAATGIPVDKFCDCDLIARVEERVRDEDVAAVMGVRAEVGPWFPARIVEELQSAVEKARVDAVLEAAAVVRDHRVRGYFCSCGAEVNSQEGHHIAAIDALRGAE